MGKSKSKAKANGERTLTRAERAQIALASSILSGEDDWPTLNLKGAVTEAKGEMIARLLRLQRKDDPKRPIRIEIDSPGGSLSGMLSIYEAMMEVGNVETRCSGIAMSAAAWIFFAGTRRICTQNSAILVHQSLLPGKYIGAKYGSMNATDFRKAAIHSDRTDARLAELLSRHTGYDVKTTTRWMRESKQWWGDEAYAVGLVHEVEGRVNSLKAERAAKKLVTRRLAVASKTASPGAAVEERGASKGKAARKQTAAPTAAQLG